MECIYLIKDECRASPFTKKKKMGNYESVGEDIECYKPSEDDKKYCKTYDFRTCPRFVGYQEHLVAESGKKS